MKFKVGDNVKINPKIKEFRYTCGGIDHDEIGKISSINSDGVIRINFPSAPWWYGLESEIVFAQFTKEDLQFGDILTLRNGEKHVYASGYMYGEDGKYYLDCERVDEYYNDDLTSVESSDYDIVKVERATKSEVIFERKEEAKEMTVEEISKALGYEVKVVKSK